MYTFIHFKRKRRRDRDGDVKKEKEREIKDGERNFSLLTLAYLTNPPNKVFCADGNVFLFLNISTTDSFIVFSQHSRL